jgi:hypothetical protein
MPDDDFDPVPLDLDSPEARAAIEKAQELIAAAVTARSAGTAEEWTNYELAVNKLVAETLTDSPEVTVDRLAWALHGLATVASDPGSAPTTA